MENNPVFKILNSFSRKEMTYFHEFVLSPYHNKHHGVRVIVDYLNTIYPNFTAKNCSVEKLLQLSFDSKGVNKTKLALVFTYIMKLLQRFISQREYDTKDDVQGLYLISGLQKKKLFDLGQKHVRKIEKRLKLMEHVQDVDFEYFQMKLVAEKNALSSNQGIILDKAELLQKQKYLDHHYLAEKFRDACEWAVRGRIIKQEEDPFNQNSFLQKFKQDTKSFKNVPAVEVYRRIYQMILSENPDEYLAALEYLQQVESAFPLEELQNIYNYFQNFCIQQINLGNRSFLTETFKLYKLLLENKVLFDRDVLHEWHYKNIVTVAIRLNELDWANIFIKKYKEALLPDIAENAYSFNLASLYYSQGELSEVLPLLLSVEYTNLRYNLSAKALLLRTYYDLDEIEALNSLYDSFRHYLKRNRNIAATRKSGYLNLFKITRSIARIKTNLAFTKTQKSIDLIEKARKEMEDTKDLYNREWVLEKIDQLEDRIKRK